MFSLIVYCVLFLCFMFFGCGVFISGGLDHSGLVLLEYCFFLDYVSFWFLAMLLFCGTLSLFFCVHYLGGYLDSFILCWSMVGFLFVMSCLVMSGCYVVSLIFWEYLGIVSFLLILYYGNQGSLRATLVTLFASRFGDVSFFVLLLWSGFWFLDVSSVFFIFFVCLIIMSKSACYPFMTWLLEAMRAPTPVSSLVHSSTLVAAGVWFFFRYSDFLGSGLQGVILFFSLTSIMISSFCSIVFVDLKKIVALSTCNNVSWCLLFFVLGDVFLGLVQLVSHGVCKCFLFISLGDLMSSSGGGQDYRGVFSSCYSGFLGVCVQGVLILSLCGVPFLGVFFSKHLLLSGFLFNYSVFLSVLLCFCFFLSYVYSFRLLFMLWGVNGFMFYGVSSYFILVLFCSLFGSVCNFVMSCFFYEFFLLGFVYSFFVLFLQLVGSLVGAVFYYHYDYFSLFFCRWGSLLWGCEGVVLYFYFSFLRVLNYSGLGNYRWEFFGVSGIFSMISGLGVFSFWYSFKFLIGSFIFVFLFSYLFFCCFGVLCACSFFVSLVIF